MGKLIIKTALITLCCTIVAFFGVVGILYVYSPKSIGKFLDNVGKSQKAVQYYQKQYDSKKQDEDLIVLLEKAEGVKDYSVMEKYYSVLVEKDNFNDICISQDKLVSKYSVKFSEYSYINYTISTFYVKSFNDVLGIISSSINANGYTQNNCLRALITVCQRDVSAIQLSQLKEYLTEQKANFDESEQQIASEDISSIDLLLG